MCEVEQKKDLANIRMKQPTESPTTLFLQIQRIENKYRGRVSALSERDKLTTIIQRAPAKYGMVIIHMCLRDAAKLGMDTSFAQRSAEGDV